MTYLLRLSSEHARAVAHACELYGRIRMGQLREIADELSGIDFDRRADAEKVCDALKGILFPELTSSGHYHGICSPAAGQTAHLCYEVEKSLRHRIAWTERPYTTGDGLCSNDHYEPILFPAGVAPRPECAAEDGRQPEIEYNGIRVADALAELVGTRDVIETLRVICRWKDAASVGVV